MLKIWGRTSKAVFACVASISFIGASAAFKPAPINALKVSSTRTNLVAPKLAIDGEGLTLIGDTIPVADAIEAVGAAPILRANPGTDRSELAELASDPDVFVNPVGGLEFIDRGLATGVGESRTSAAVSAIGPALLAPASDTFLLESRPGSSRTIYLDFNGATVTGSSWNLGDADPLIAPAFDRDGDPTAFNDYELAFIQEVWSVVAEDYAPFDVNVTTKDLGVAKYTRDSSGDTEYGINVVITNEIVGNVCDGFNCAGVASMNSFSSTFNGWYSPAWSFAFDYSYQYAAMTISHEVGHTLGLSHDGKGATAYYNGQGIWAPIMGGGGAAALYQWSNGDYDGANQGEDDTSIIAVNAPRLTDDYADTTESAALADPSTPINGVITTRGDVDVFKINATVGSLHLQASPAANGPNLDIELKLMDSSGSVVATANGVSGSMSGQTGMLTVSPKGLGAWIDYTVNSAETMYVSIGGVGEGDTATGYSDYGSLGSYTLSTANPKLTVAVKGPGTVTTSVAGISGCSTSCSATFSPSSSSYVTITATASAGAALAYWVGPCEIFYYNINQFSGCKVPMDQAREVTAVFRYNRTINVSKVGSGTVTATSGVAGDYYVHDWISCGATCSSSNWRPYADLVATPADGYVFSQWTGGCTGETPTCHLLMTESKDVTATFATENDLTVNVSGDGSVSSNPIGISCTGPTNATPCTHTFAASGSVTLTATPSSTTAFSGWSGACTGTGTCTVSMNAARSVTATFVAGGVLTVNIAGLGTVTSNPEGINCSGPTGGSPCVHGFEESQVVALTATADLNGYSIFSGWSGACSGSGSCSVTMSEARTVTATFTPNYLFHATVDGPTGAGHITSSVDDFNCSNSGYSMCNTLYMAGLSITFTAHDDLGFFTGWSGACTGTSRQCTITISAETWLTAEFETGDAYYLMITGGHGSFTATKGYVTCSSSWCTGYKPTGSTTILTAVPDAGNTFAGWDSGCTGLSTCSYPTGESWTLTAKFADASPISAGDFFSCRAFDSGSAKCWGANTNGQLGVGSTTNAAKAALVKSLSNVAAVTTGGSHACAVLEAGTVKCWGKNANGQIGNNSTTDAKTPVAISGLSGVQYVEAGTDHTCALLANGSVKCWGKGANGRLGNNSMNDSKTPVSVSGIGGSSTKAVAISAGGAHTCAILVNGTVKCWGANASGQLGNNSTTDAKIPVLVQGIAGARVISAGGAHTCIVLSTGTAKCWGANASGQLGNNSTATSKIAVSVSGLTGLLSISAGTSHTCATGMSAAVKCWGSGSNGRLGNNSSAGSKVPTASTGTTFGDYVSAGGAHTCAVVTVAVGWQTTTYYKCWGAGTSGQIGNNKFADSLVAVNVL